MCLGISVNWYCINAGWPYNKEEKIYEAIREKGGGGKSFLWRPGRIKGWRIGEVGIPQMKVAVKQ